MTDVPLRRLGASDLKIAPLVLGSNVFGWTADRDTSFAILDAFVDGGGTMIDTADVYSNWAEGNRGGEAETIIGEWLRVSGKRDRVLIASKVGWAPEKGGELEPAHIAAACDESLRRLGIDCIDLYYAHQDDAKVPQDAVAEALGAIVRAGKARVLGASNIHAARLKSAIEGQRAAGLPHYQVVQPAYNLIRREEFEGELEDYCVEHNIGVLTYQSIAGGFLTGKYRSRADAEGRARGGSAARLLEDGGAMTILAALDEVTAETGATRAQVALAWLLAQPGVTAPIASATSVEQVRELMAATALTLSADQLERLDDAGA